MNPLEGKEKMKDRYGELVFSAIRDLTREVLKEVKRVRWTKQIKTMEGRLKEPLWAAVRCTQRRFLIDS